MAFGFIFSGPSSTRVLVLLTLLIAATLPRPCAPVEIKVTNGYTQDGQTYSTQTILNLKGLDKTRAVTSVVSVSNGQVKSTEFRISGMDKNAPDTFATGLYMTVYKFHITGTSSYMYINYLPPNAYIHLLQTSSQKSDTRSIAFETGWEYNTTVFIEDSDFIHAHPLHAFRVFKPESSTVHEYVDNCVLHVRKIKITAGSGLIQLVDSPLPIRKQSALVFEDVHCINCVANILSLGQFVLTDHSAFIIRDVKNEHTTASAVTPFLQAVSINVDATSVIAFVDIDTANSFKATTSAAIVITEIRGAGTIVFSRWLMQMSGLNNRQPLSNTNFWVSARTNANTDLTPEQLRTYQNFNVNMDNTYNWDGTGADGTTCVPVGGGIPDRATYKLVDGKCTATCKEGFVPPACTAPAKSQCRVDNCDLCYRITKTKCMMCPEHTTYENNDQMCRCPASLEHCQLCPSESTCTMCVEGYNLTRGGAPCFPCSLTVPNCAHCDEPNVCAQCVPHYNVSSDKKECYPCKVANCAHCSGNDVCDQCVPHYNLSSTGQNRCMSCKVPGCLLCKDDDICDKCTDGFTVPEGKNVCVACPIVHCERCDVEGVCAQCKDKHTPDGGKRCHPCTMPGCLTCDGDEQCVACDDKYTLVGKTCMSCDIPNCKSCLAHGVCGQCELTYQIVVNAGKTTCVHCDMPNCATCLADDVCHECVPHYNLSTADNRCFPCDIDGCAACDSDSHCSACANGNPPVDDGKECVSCDVSGCMYCNATDSCAECKDRYSIAASDAAGKLKCISCNVDHCLFCGAADTCQECEVSYNVSKNGARCNSCFMSNCQRCDEDGVCAQCDTTLSVSLNGGECTPCDIGNCTYCAQAGECGMCKCGLVPTSDGEKCVLCTAANCKHCELPGDGTKCAECIKGYNVADGSCRKSGLPSWAVFLIVVAITVVLVTAFCLGVFFYLRHQAEMRQNERDAEERRRNRLAKGRGTRHHTEIGILDLGDIEGAASGVRDNQGKYNALY